MPYNPGTGIYTLPAIYLAIPGTTIIAAQHNTPLEDLEVANNYARPIVAGGTGQNSAVLARGSTGLATMGNIGVKGSNIASAAALPLVADFNYFHVTGVVTVTSISTRPAGERIVLEFEGALILTHNATSLILLGGGNILTGAGDVSEFVSEGSGNWRQVTYNRAAGGAAASQQTFATPGAATWTKPAGCIRADFEGVGGGGGSGGINGTTAASGATGGGGSGFYGRTGPIDVTAAATVALVIGAAGTAGDLNTNGGNGGATTAIVGATTYTWGGGVGSTFLNAGANGNPIGGVGGVGTNLVGGSQQGGQGKYDHANLDASSGAGGGTPLGTGGIQQRRISAGVNNGTVGANFGAGAGGALNVNTNSDQTGAAGTGGYIRVTEYYV